MKLLILKYFNLQMKLFSLVYSTNSNCGLDWLQWFLHLFFFFLLLFFCHSLSLPVAAFVSLIPFHCFTTISFPLRDITYQIIISCTRLYTFEKKRENDR